MGSLPPPRCSAPPSSVFLSTQPDKESLFPDGSKTMAMARLNLNRYWGRLFIASYARIGQGQRHGLSPPIEVGAPGSERHGGGQLTARASTTRPESRQRRCLSQTAPPDMDSIRHGERNRLRLNSVLGKAGSMRKAKSIPRQILHRPYMKPAARRKAQTATRISA